MATTGSGDSLLEQEMFHVEGGMDTLMGLWVTHANAGTPPRDCSHGWPVPGQGPLRDCDSPAHWTGFDGFSVIHDKKKENRDWGWRIGLYVNVWGFFACVLFLNRKLDKQRFVMALQQNSPNLDCFADNDAAWSRRVELIVLRPQFHMQNSSLCICFAIFQKNSCQIYRIIES